MRTLLAFLDIEYDSNKHNRTILTELKLFWVRLVGATLYPGKDITYDTTYKINNHQENKENTIFVTTGVQAGTVYILEQPQTLPRMPFFNFLI